MSEAPKVEPLSAEELAEARTHARTYRAAWKHLGPGHCAVCWAAWPCRTAVWIATLDARDDRIAQLEAALEYARPDGHATGACAVELDAIMQCSGSASCDCGANMRNDAIDAALEGTGDREDEHSSAASLEDDNQYDDDQYYGNQYEDRYENPYR